MSAITSGIDKISTDGLNQIVGFNEVSDWHALRQVNKKTHIAMAQLPRRIKIVDHGTTADLNKIYEASIRGSRIILDMHDDTNSRYNNLISLQPCLSSIDKITNVFIGVFALLMLERSGTFDEAAITKIQEVEDAFRAKAELRYY